MNTPSAGRTAAEKIDSLGAEVLGLQNLLTDAETNIAGLERSLSEANAEIARLSAAQTESSWDVPILPGRFYQYS